VQKPISYRIFVVDDEEIITTTLVSILNMSGFDAYGFVRPLEALQAAQSKRPDILLTDVVMPEMFGTDLAIQMKQQCPECRVLLFSGQAGVSNFLEKARERGHEFTLLSKPIHPSDLLEEIRRSAA
jgi:FixJ family two-component response regulator